MGSADRKIMGQVGGYSEGADMSLKYTAGSLMGRDNRKRLPDGLWAIREASQRPPHVE